MFEFSDKTEFQKYTIYDNCLENILHIHDELTKCT